MEKAQSQLNPILNFKRKSARTTAVSG